ncbi:MAG: DNA recombination protein RmuC [Deltaproteobacteria bacterium]|nr:DNA recombination protein RmuC [Deltaproteobacteria bacterium]
MIDILTWLIVLLLVTNGVLLVIQIWMSGSSAQNAEKIIQEEFRIGREESATAARELREEVSGGLKSAADIMVKIVGEMGNQQSNQFEGITRQLKELTDTNQSRIERLTATVDVQLRRLQDRNENKLEEIRKTVDEKLHGTLEMRLGESFRLVTERLEAVQRGLDDMQGLATGVGELRRVLTSVRARGTWGEIQIGALLEQIFTPDQYGKNVQTKDDSFETVEYAIRLPGPDNNKESCVWLPIDSKFPPGDYIRLQEASDSVDADGVQEATTALMKTARETAQDIRDKYLNPPRTTDFAIMYLPIEGIYAEILRQPGLIEELQQTYRIVVAGPTTLSAILNSLRMGFRTLAIEQRASEVWKVLAAVKTEFGKFGEVLDNVKKQLDTATRTVEETGVRTRVMERHLQDVEPPSSDKAVEVLNFATGESSSFEPEGPGKGADEPKFDESKF